MFWFENMYFGENMCYLESNFFGDFFYVFVVNFFLFVENMSFGENVFLAQFFF